LRLVLQQPLSPFHDRSGRILEFSAGLISPNRSNSLRKPVQMNDGPDGPIDVYGWFLRPDPGEIKVTIVEAGKYGYGLGSLGKVVFQQSVIGLKQIGPRDVAGRKGR